MSYHKFQKEAGEYSKWRRENNLPYLDSEKVDGIIRDKWIDDKRFKELISFILENWESGNCDDFIPPVVTALIEQKEIALFKRLWKGIIRNRIEKLWNYADTDLDLKMLDKLDVSDFNMYRVESYQNIKRVTAFHRNFTLAAIDQYIKGLELLQDKEEIDRILSLRDNIYRLQKPKPKPSTDKRKIDESLFWDLIQEARSGSQDQFEFLELLKAKLESFKPNEIRKFDQIFQTKLNELNSWDIWALAYIVRRGCGDDEFDYFKAWVISKGQKAFMDIISFKYHEFANLFDEDPQLEDFMYMAENVYENKTGEIMKPVKVKFQKIKGKEWKEDKLEALFPELCEIFEYKK